MLLRTIVALVGFIELVAPRRFAQFWVRLTCKDPEDVELRRWVVTSIRLEGVALLGWAIWQHTNAMEDERAGSVDDTIAEFTSPDSEAESDEPTPALRPETTRYDIATALDESDDPLAVSELVDRSADTEWEVGRSTASATLYRMHSDGLVDRQEREAGRGYEYWLSEAGKTALRSEPVTDGAGDESA